MQTATFDAPRDEYTVPCILHMADKGLKERETKVPGCGSLMAPIHKSLELMSE